MSGFLGIDTARRALQTAQMGMDVTAHNIANANTPGFSRRRAILGTTEPFPAPSYNRPLIQGEIGTGVKVESIRRIRDSYFDGQIRKENQNLGEWTVKDNALKQVETIFNEPSEAGLLNTMGEFWNAWQQLSKNPESMSARSNMYQSAEMMTTVFNQTSGKLGRLRDNLNDQVAIKVAEVNDMAVRIADLNKDIMYQRTFGIEPNDLLDQRDQLIDQISGLVDVQVVELGNGTAVVTLNGGQLVAEYGANKLAVVENAANQGYYDIAWEMNTAIKANIHGGELRALTESRDTVVTGYQAQLDALAAGMINEVNAVHGAGYGLDGNTGYMFFDTDPAKATAANISLSADISDVSHIAASATLAGIPGDNANALAIAKLKDMQVIIGTDTVTMNDYYRAVVTNLGIKSQEAGRMVANGKLYYDLIENHRHSVSGVSLDEEASNMIKFQRAYEAAARIVTMYDDMLDTLINRMGR